MTEGDKKITINLPKVLASVLTAGLIGSFAWIIKVESQMTQVRADVEDIEDEISDLEREVASVKEGHLSNKIDLTMVQGIMKSIEGKVDDVKRAIEKLGDHH